MRRESATCWAYQPPTLRRRSIAARRCCTNDSTSETRMNREYDLNAQVEANLRTIWKHASVIQPTWTPEQVEARAKRFEVRTGRLAVADLMGFLLLPVIILGVVVAVDGRALIQEQYGRIQFAGWALLLLCSVVGL